jgi:hypothetical protein
MSVPLTLLEVESASWVLIMRLKIPSFCNKRYERLNKKERKNVRVNAAGRWKTDELQRTLPTTQETPTKFPELSECAEA